MPASTPGHSGVSAFAPAWWCRGAHAQTIWAATLRPAPYVSVQRERWDTPDHDFLDVDHLPATPGRPILVVLHGLEGSSKGKPVRGLLRGAQRRGWRGLALNFRSCSGTPNRLRRSYHGGDTADLRWAIERVIREYPDVPVLCVGMSLGANMLLKYLGEQPDAVPAAVTAAVAISTPFDLAASALAFERGAVNRFYMARLVSSLKRRTRAKLHEYPDLVDRRRLAALRTIREFDELVTAPLNGFGTAATYWAASSCRQFLATIRRPTLLIQAIDDPVVPNDDQLWREMSRNPSLTLTCTNGGGHVGFLSGIWPWRPIAWAEERALTFLAKHSPP